MGVSDTNPLTQLGLPPGFGFTRRTKSFWFSTYAEKSLGTTSLQIIEISICISSTRGFCPLDDWVLCRIYKKNSSAQKPIFDDPAKEQSHGSSSSSSQFDDMLTDSSLPEINHHFFALPKPNSFKPTRPDDKINIQSLFGQFRLGNSADPPPPCQN
ncbi:NAC domain-containing protein JA2L [Camellia lanceoleosa]|uniref:NAC domain-containing protein JA2L n=1 Tax=Camellia lanceoleosa TaxID=1840588 RepID=A0ACC0HJT8_9ERIC|nr:NAC domain-containing protein JA2L [Camellia lanceoleosa]